MALYGTNHSGMLRGDPPSFSAPHPDNAASIRITSPWDLKADLSEALNTIEAPGSFAFFAAIQPDVLPQIVVKDVGTICLPLDIVQAQLLETKIHQISNTQSASAANSPRGHWRLNTDGFSIKNSVEWDTFLEQTVVPHVAQELGVSEPVSAKLKAVLLQGKGPAGEICSLNTDKNSKHFATLLINLPSRHVGGDIVTSHDGVKKCFGISAAKLSWVGWYEDAHHDVLPIKEGYRFALAYSLAVNTFERTPSAALIGEDSKKLQKVLETWHYEIINGCRPPAPLFFVMDHKFDGTNTSFRTLKTRDKHIVQRLRDLLSELSFDLFFADLLKIELGATKPDHTSYAYNDGRCLPGEYGHNSLSSRHKSQFCSVDELFSFEYSTKAVFSLDGKQIVSTIQIPNGDVLQSIVPFVDKPDKEEVERHPRGDLWSLKHWYNRSALVIVPTMGTYPFLLKALSDRAYGGCNDSMSYHSLSTLTEYYAGLCLYPRVSGHWLTILNQLCRQIFTHRRRTNSGAPINDQLVCSIMKVAILHDQQDLLDLCATADAPVSIHFLIWAGSEVDTGRVPYGKLRTIILSSISARKTMSGKLAAIEAFSSDVEEISDDMRSLLSLGAEAALENCGTILLHKGDAAVVFDLVNCYMDFAYLTSRLAPLLENCVSAPFMLELTKIMRQNINRNQHLRTEYLAVYKQLARTTIKVLSVQTMGPNSGPPVSFNPAGSTGGAWQRSTTHSTLPDITSNAFTKFVDYDALSQFVVGLFKMGLTSDVELLAKHLCAHATTMRPAELNRLYIPLLQDLIALLEEHKISLATPRYQQLYQTLLRAYIIRFVTKPSGLTWKHDRVPCNCLACASMNRFLENPIEASGRFTLGRARREHLRNMLDDSKADCTCKILEHSSPSTLLVTKNSQHHFNPTWIQRRLEAENNISIFNQEKLRVLLQGHYDNVTSFNKLDASDWPHYLPFNYLTPTISSFSPTTTRQRKPLAPISGNVHDELARLQDEIAKAGGTELPSSRPRPSPPTTGRAAGYTGVPLSSVMSSPRAELGYSTVQPVSSVSNTGTALTSAVRRRSSPNRRRSTTTIYTGPSRLPPVPSLAGMKRKATTVIDLTEDSD
ncbi:hypothetical protein BKA67DRAFT_546652 [Truncatella angustata]|uniref:Uncharacterized protein n=1 Tax=Truncatella angustata TaxID=152316 RepID=A0A9P8UXI8_9PEZI|nr:uncharacterized protein BKA67DRAFT_546652 [Truncatella angustata]KAH6660052.1 hypothetical protein BKA67DRAFT_546652 [Truncatella angustata]